METNIDYYVYMFSRDTQRMLGYFSGRIPHAPLPTMIDEAHSLSVNGVHISGNIDKSPIGYTFTIALVDDPQAQISNFDTFMHTNNITGTTFSGDTPVQSINMLLNNPYTIQGNRLPFVQTNKQYKVYIHTINNHLVHSTHIDIDNVDTTPSTNVEFSDSCFPRVVTVDGNVTDILHQGNLTMGNLDGDIVFTTNISTSFPSNTTYYASIYDANTDFSDENQFLTHLYTAPMLSNVIEPNQSLQIQFSHYYPNIESTTETNLQKDQYYLMSLLLLDSKTNHFSGEIRQESLPTFYPEIDMSSFAAAPRPITPNPT